MNPSRDAAGGGTGSHVVLAIEASQRAGGVAIAEGGRVHVEMMSAAGRHDDDLMPAIDRLVRRAGLGPCDLTHVGVSIGPGGFTGLRISVATAKMLALALGTRVVGVPTALVVAEACRDDRADAGPVAVVLAVKGETFWCTTLRREAGGWHGADSGALVSPDDFEATGLAAVIADRYLPEFARDRCTAARVPVLEPSFDPGACLICAQRLVADGHPSEPLALAPLYPRPPEAVRLWDEAARPTP